MKRIYYIIALLLLLTVQLKAQKVDATLELLVSIAEKDLVTQDPTVQDPVTVNAKLVWAESKKQLAVVIKASIFTDWHIYSKVTKGSPFIPTTIEVKFPEGALLPIGEWEKPFDEEFNESSSIYVGDELFFIRYYNVKDAVKIQGEFRAGLYYQACDPFQCFPPKTKMISL
ncbi:hypothetical protein M4I21_15380 [Cellulophaga sp. 20_2_10]|uniref:protein-disulfide reductase DsbD domain-containing protein n=1 Tax=Cellulophaga sp. 20_2_10 TaxID=2942476 RepID=UPI00201B330B|nr:protein-disulfide reductase DsbD domain-containing protein [Cellulophaga sp. 20_2_10]MCL5247203.1 hypothetical protein [Cellulophaga sp. 20_2_10]